MIQSGTVIENEHPATAAGGNEESNPSEQTSVEAVQGVIQTAYQVSGLMAETTLVFAVVARDNCMIKAQDAWTVAPENLKDAVSAGSDCVTRIAAVVVREVGLISGFRKQVVTIPRTLSRGGDHP